MTAEWVRWAFAIVIAVGALIFGFLRWKIAHDDKTASQATKAKLEQRSAEKVTIKLQSSHGERGAASLSASVASSERIADVIIRVHLDDRWRTSADSDQWFNDDPAPITFEKVGGPNRHHRSQFWEGYVEQRQPPGLAVWWEAFWTDDHGNLWRQERPAGQAKPNLPERL